MRKQWLKWVLLFCLWTVIGLAFATQLYLSRAKIGDPPGLVRVVHNGVAAADFAVPAAAPPPVGS